MTPTRRKPSLPHAPSEAARKLDRMMKECQSDLHREGDLVNAQDPEQAQIFLAACRMVISGYRAEISRAGDNSLYVRAAYELLHHFLEEQFAAHRRAA